MLNQSIMAEVRRVFLQVALSIGHAEPNSETAVVEGIGQGDRIRMQQIDEIGTARKG